MNWNEYVYKNWNKVRIYYLILNIILFVLLGISYYFFKDSYITMIFLILFGFFSSFWFILLQSKPNMSVVESMVGESYYKKHKKAIWIVYIVIGIIIVVLLAIILPEIG